MYVINVFNGVTIDRRVVDSSLASEHYILLDVNTRLQYDLRLLVSLVGI